MMACICWWYWWPCYCSRPIRCTGQTDSSKWWVAACAAAIVAAQLNCRGWCLMCTNTERQELSPAFRRQGIARSLPYPGQLGLTPVAGFDLGASQVLLAKGPLSQDWLHSTSVCCVHLLVAVAVMVCCGTNHTMQWFVTAIKDRWMCFPSQLLPLACFDVVLGLAVVQC